MCREGAGDRLIGGFPSRATDPIVQPNRGDRRTAGNAFTGVLHPGRDIKLRQARAAHRTVMIARGDRAGTAAWPPRVGGIFKTLASGRSLKADSRRCRDC